MAYAEASTEPVRKESLMGDSAGLIERLANARGRLMKIADTLHGTTPHDASDKPGAPSPNTLRRHIDGAHSVISQIESELDRIEGRL